MTNPSNSFRRCDFAHPAAGLDCNLIMTCTVPTWVSWVLGSDPEKELGVSETHGQEPVEDNRWGCGAGPIKSAEHDDADRTPVNRCGQGEMRPRADLTISASPTRSSRASTVIQHVPGGEEWPDPIATFSHCSGAAPEEHSPDMKAGECLATEQWLFVEGDSSGTPLHCRATSSRLLHTCWPNPQPCSEADSSLATD